MRDGNAVERAEFVRAYARCFPEMGEDFAGFVYNNLTGPDDDFLAEVKEWAEELAPTAKA